MYFYLKKKVYITKNKHNLKEIYSAEQCDILIKVGDGSVNKQHLTNSNTDENPPLPIRGRRMRGEPAGRWWGPIETIPRHTPAKMATSVLSSKMDSLRIVGDDRARKARENDEDIAILSTFLPPSLVGQTASSQRPFECALGKECRLGDVKLAKPGQCSCHLRRPLGHLGGPLCQGN